MTTHKFTAPQTGLYWFHWSVGLMSGWSTTVTLAGGPRQPKILRTFTNHLPGSPVTTSRDELIQLQGGHQLWLNSNAPLYSDQFMQTSFTGFLLDNLFSPLVAFHVARSSSMTNANYGSKLAYNVELVDTHNAWNPSKYEYVVPVAGVYVISIMTGVYQKDIFSHAFYIEGNELFSSSFTYTSTAHTGQMTISRTVIIPLNAGDRLYSQFTISGSSIYSDSDYQTAFMGFLYSPALFSPMAWCITTNIDTHYHGPRDPFKFNEVIYDLGNGWNSTANQYRVVLSGLYYVHLGAGIYCPATLPSMMELMVNNQPAVNYLYAPDINTYHITLSRAIIIRLMYNDTIHIRVPNDTYHLSAMHESESMFSGFLIHAE